MARARIKCLHQDDCRIGAGVDRGFAAVIKLLADRDIIQLGAFDDCLRELLGCLAAKDFLHERIVRSQRLDHVLESVGHLDDVQVLVDRQCREQPPLHHRQRRLPEFP